MSKSTARSPRRKADRPKKPYPDFPLSPHSSGKWQKKIRGSTYYFGRWGNWVNGKLVRIDGDGWQEALELYRAQADDLHAGRTPRLRNPDGLTVATLCNHFLTAKLRKKESHELTDQTFADYRIITDLIVAAFGTERLVDDLAADDFAQLRSVMAKRWGPERLGNSIVRVRSVFKYGTENGLIDKPVRYGSEFRKHGLSVLRRNKAANGERMLEPEQLRRLLDALEGKEVETGRTDEAGEPVRVKVPPNPQLRAMVLLGLNAGMGNTDCASLARMSVNLKTGWLNFPRPKTGIPRRCPLWPETVAALNDALEHRPEPSSDDYRELVFLTSAGKPWIHAQGYRQDYIAVHFAELLKVTELHRPRIGFYTLRHVFRTIADAARDPVAIDIIMGHSDPTMGGHYRERVDDARLIVVVDVVRAWLWPDA